MKMDWDAISKLPEDARVRLIYNPLRDIWEPVAAADIWGSVFGANDSGDEQPGDVNTQPIEIKSIEEVFGAPETTAETDEEKQERMWKAICDLAGGG